MADLYVVPLLLGHIVRDKSAFTYLKNMGKVEAFPVIAWYIGGGNVNILVDTGTNSPDETADFHKPLIQKPEEKLPAALKALGLEPDDIDIVVNTHLHWDHCYNNHLFLKAKFFVQREELRYAIDPLPIHIHGYEPPSMGMIPPFIGTKFEVVEGDVDIAPGVSLIFTPGHTPGGLSVLLKTSKGKILIAGDTIPLFESWKGDAAIPNAVHLDLHEYDKTIKKIVGIAPDIILPGHDSLVFNQKKYSLE